MSTDVSRSSGAGKKGEIPELQEELNHPKEDKRKEAIKKVIAAMTVGKDVSSLFPDVLNCIATNNIELKKLVYLYVINHAKMQPDRALLAINTFQRDATDPNPLVRALAIRTMGCIRVEKGAEHLIEPLKSALKDKDPYVRKTAALCVAKLYDMSPDVVETQGFLESLLGLLSDSNPSVVANAVAALSEIDDLSAKTIFNINFSNLGKLQAALNECTEWGQVFILTSLANYVPADSKEAESICERVVPRLNHGNSAVVFAAVKLLIMYMEHISSPETVKGLVRKMAPPLVTLLTTKEPEIQYVALRNINLIIQKKHNILSNEMRVFFVKYNDPIYVKMEKLEIMIMLSNDKNIEQVLNEFKEAASEVDVEFVRKAVRAIGRCAIKLEKASEKCIQVLLDLIQTKVNYVVQEAIIVIRDIFRKYPNRYESIISVLCENLDTLDEPEAKAAMIWIIGEYAERIENADELLESFLESFSEETPLVQLQLLTAVVKLFLKKPNETQEMVQKVLNVATQETDNPDLRDRGYVYWRLLSTDPEAAKAVVLGEKAVITDSTIQLDNSILQPLLQNISTLASIYHKLPDTFLAKTPASTKTKEKKKKEKRKENDESLLGTDTQTEGNILDLSNNLFDLGIESEAAPSMELVVPADRGFGMSISAAFTRRDGSVNLDLLLSNGTQGPISGLAIQFNKNSWSLVPAQPSVPVMPGQNLPVSLLLGHHPNQAVPGPISPVVQIAIKAVISNTERVMYFQLSLPTQLLFMESGQLARDEFLSLWRSLGGESVKDIPLGFNADQAQKRLEANRCFYIARRTVGNQELLYFSSRVPRDSASLLLEVAFGQGQAHVTVKATSAELIPAFEQAIASILAK
eukprot:TRINITY_DN3828_c0_g1_i1.p1 TRINITY_DN3828_c0_g1~~TRINITY_DN3828_c0_g1_i1.p1  ORF type:complete len:864 (+),score=270.43 TRINITY_DN3828_c0_g1_i1:134-2725(+)